MTQAQDRAVRQVGRLVARRNRLRAAEEQTTTRLKAALLVARQRGVTVPDLMSVLGVSRTLIYRLAPGAWSPGPGGQPRPTPGIRAVKTLDNARPTPETGPVAPRGTEEREPYEQADQAAATG